MVTGAVGAVVDGGANPWGEAGWLGGTSLRAWEEQLPKERAEQWDELKAKLGAAGSDMRWRAVAWVVRGELDRVRRVYQQALNMDSEPYRAELTRRAGVQLREAWDKLEAG